MTLQKHVDARTGYPSIAEYQEDAGVESFSEVTTDPLTLHIDDAAVTKPLAQWIRETGRDLFAFRRGSAP